MGYRSDVGLVLTKHGVSVLHKRLNKRSLSAKVKQDVKELLTYSDEHYKDNGSGAEVWRWNDIKWYDSEPYFFEEIKFIADTIRELSDEDYHFIRIGEDDDDIDVRGTFWNNPFELSIQRSISLHE